MKGALISLLTALLVWASVGWAQARDMRAAHREKEQILSRLKAQLEQEKAQAEEQARQQRKRIATDMAALKKAVDDLKAQTHALSRANERLEKDISALSAEEIVLDGQLSRTDSVMKELAGFVRTSAKDAQSLIGQSPQTALARDRGDFLKAIIAQDQFPGMDDIVKMADLLSDEMALSGQVRRTESTFVDRTGRQVRGQILILGNFTAAYRLGDETGFLKYSQTSGRFFALSKLPPSSMQKKIAQYMDGLSEAVPMDISRGAALSQLTHRLSLMEQIPKGGPIVWPILAILALAALMIMERIIYLLRKRMDADGFMDQVKALISCEKWESCAQFCQTSPKPIAKVLLAGLAARHMNREDMENALQEAILIEIPGFERFLSTLGMLAAIAPLLGLLGTVTGMINTFHAITAFGTSDPRMMSGGISEALVTTMLGLSVAIPIVFSHTLLSRVVENRIAQMEEKAVAFVNLVHQSRNGTCSQ